jgi:hypothetical protein
MTDAEFTALYNSVLKQKTASGRTTAVTNAINNNRNYFTSAQARQLIQLVNSQASRLKLAKLVYPRTTDPASFSTVNDLLNRANQNNLTAFIKTYNANNPGHAGNAGNGIPISDANFAVFYRNLQQEFGQTPKIRMITDAFTNPGYSYSSSQIRQLLELINAESDRLKLAKLGYSKAIDPGNYIVVSNMLASQASRNDLANYMSTYNSTNPGSVTAWTNSKFNTLYRTAQRQTPTSVRVTYLSDLFSNAANYYTASQARQMIQLVSDEANRLYLTKLSYRGLTDKTNFTVLYDLLGRQSSRDELAVHVNAYNSGSLGLPVISGVAMTDAEYNAIYRDVQNRWGLGAKMSALTDIFQTAAYHFTTSQARQLIMLVSAESNRLDLAKASYDNIVDPANFTQLNDVFSTQSSRDDLAAYVRGFGTNTGYSAKTPMSNANYTTLYTDIANDWGLFVKMSRLVDVFNDPNNFFTTAQARQLVDLVSSETNRLALAKSSYDNITDPENFRLMYDLLSSQSSKDELANFVNDNAYLRN